MIELLLKLEMSLWINDTRNNFEYMNRVLHEDFKEFGKSGKVYNKEDLLKSLDLNIDAVFPFPDISVKQLDETTFLITYISQTKENGEIVKANRSSIWVGKETFQLLFHQGTITK